MHTFVSDIYRQSKQYNKAVTTRGAERKAKKLIFKLL